MAYNKETGMYEGYIYLILNDVHPELIYVGQTSQELITRWRGHVGQIKNHTYTDKLHNAMEKYGVEHFAMDGIEKCIAPTKKELISKLDDRERYYINLFDSFCNGYNLTKGGRDSKENQMRPVKKYSIDGIYIATYESVDSLKEEFEKVSTIYSCCSGECKYAYGHIWRYIENELEDFPLPTTEEKQEALVRYYSLLEIDKYDYRGNLLITYKNISEAEEIEKVKRKKIVDCCTGKRVYIGINTFRFHHENFNTYKTYRDKPKLVEQYDTDGNFINVYESVRNAGKTIGENYQPITQVCRGEKKTAYGYIWRYVENELIFPDLKHNGHCKKVYKYDRDYNLISVYPSVTEASEHEDVSIFTIINSCNEYRNNSNSEYTYSYKELSNEQIKNKFSNKHNKKVNMYDLEDNYIRTFSSFNEAGEFIGTKYASTLISRCCSGRRKTTCGYKWYHSNNPNQPDKTKIIA